MTIVELDDNEAVAFREFMRRHDLIYPLVGYLDSIGVNSNLANTQIILDMDKSSMVEHMSITKHYRR